MRLGPRAITRPAFLGGASSEATRRKYFGSRKLSHAAFPELPEIRRQLANPVPETARIFGRPTQPGRFPAVGWSNVCPRQVEVFHAYAQHSSGTVACEHA